MDGRIREEREALLESAEARVDAARRSWRFALLFVVNLLALACAGVIPNHAQFFGETSPLEGFVLGGTAALSVFLGAVAYRRFGPKSRVYRAFEIFEVFCITGIAPGFAYTADNGFAMFWFIYPLGPVFWAMVKPRQWRVYGLTSFCACLVVAALGWRDGRPELALLSVSVGASMGLLSAWVARLLLRNATLEAERNVTEAELRALQREHERGALLRSLEVSLGDDLHRLADDLERDPRTANEGPHARTIANELERLWSVVPACSAIALGERIEKKCRPLCAKVDYVQALRVDGGRTLDAETTTALLRIAQELVRNAATHAGATRVSLELVDDAGGTTLRVSDDGDGLSAATLATAEGGLRNASRRLDELGGALALSPLARGTEIVAHVPRGHAVRAS